jgi:hypothetical protein
LRHSLNRVFQHVLSACQKDSWTAKLFRLKHGSRIFAEGLEVQSRVPGRISGLNCGQRALLKACFLFRSQCRYQNEMLVSVVLLL